MKYIVLNASHKKGKNYKRYKTKVDDKDFSYLNQWKWNISTLGYVERADNKNRFYMHRVLMKPRKGMYVDHINGDKLDNQRSNLRICTNQQNVANHKLKKNNKSGYRGVYWFKGAWCAYIMYQRKSIYLGRFQDIHHAVLMRDFWCSFFYGKYARLNFTLVTVNS